MTHEELVVKIKVEITHHSMRLFHCQAAEMLKSLLVVAILHAPDELNECPVCIYTHEDGTYAYGGKKGWDSENYPCPTIQAIELAVAA